MSEETFEAFRRLVLQDPTLQARLRVKTDREGFEALVVQLGEEHAFNFTAAEVEAALRISRRTWLERGLLG